MGKIKVNYTTVQNSVFPRLSKAESELNSAYIGLQNAYIPSSYYRKKELRDIIENIGNIKTQIANVKTDIEKSHKKLKETEEENEIVTSRLESINLKARVKIIKNS